MVLILLVSKSRMDDKKNVPGETIRKKFFWYKHILHINERHQGITVDWSYTNLAAKHSCINLACMNPRIFSHKVKQENTCHKNQSGCQSNRRISEMLSFF